MPPVRVPHQSWILVCDGSKALLFRNEGGALALNLKLAQVTFEPHLSTRDLGAERPGRVHESLGSSRSAVQSPDWHQQAEAEFLRGVAHALDEAVHANHIKQLVLVAPPKALGELRRHLTAATNSVLSAEINKDLARLSTKEIERHLTALNRLE